MNAVHRLIATAVLTGGIAFAAPVAAQTVTFDGLANSAVIANGYAGLNWSNFYSSDGSSFTTSGYKNGRVSGTGVAYNGFANPATLSDTTAFTLNSGYFTGAWNNGLTISVVGLVAGVQAYATSFVVDASGPTLHTFDWTNLSSVTFSSAGGTSAGLSGTGTHFVVDNLTVNAAVPEPATWAMMLTGFGAVGFAMRRRQRLAVAFAR